MMSAGVAVEKASRDTKVPRTTLHLKKKTGVIKRLQALEFPTTVRSATSKPRQSTRNSVRFDNDAADLDNAEEVVHKRTAFNKYSKASSEDDHQDLGGDDRNGDKFVSDSGGNDNDDDDDIEVEDNVLDSRERAAVNTHTRFDTNSPMAKEIVSSDDDSSDGDDADYNYDDNGGNDDDIKDNKNNDSDGDDNDDTWPTANRDPPVSTPTPSCIPPAKAGNSRHSPSPEKIPPSKSRHLTVAEKMRDPSRVINNLKYCPFCPFVTDTPHIRRHIHLKHPEHAKKKDQIGRIIRMASSKASPLVPMGRIREVIGSYWGNVHLRKIAYQLVEMSSLQVYGGSWDLEGVMDTPNPFAYLKDEYISVCSPETFTFQSATAIATIPPTVFSATCSTSVAASESVSSDKNTLNRRQKMIDDGLPRQLNHNHPIMVKFRETLNFIHGVDSPVAKIYVSNMGRVLFAVNEWLQNRGFYATHWSNLFTAPVEAYQQFFEKRQSLGQTISTSVNYLKQLRMLFSLVRDEYCYNDTSFPRDGYKAAPSSEILNRIKMTECNIDLLYRKASKDSPRDLFHRKVAEAKRLPGYDVMQTVIEKITRDIPDRLDELAAAFGEDGEVSVGAMRKRLWVQKRLSYLWRKTTVSLAVNVLWTTKHRSGVVTNMTVAEWQRRVRDLSGSTVVMVAKHKTGPKEPATVVLDRSLEELMEKYYELRRRMASAELGDPFFVTSRGCRVEKFYKNVIQACGVDMSLTVFRRMVDKHAQWSKTKF